jgi:transcriptional regulator with XRE-family HTH domain
LKGLNCPVYEKKDTTGPFSNNNYNFIMDTPVRRDRMISMEGTNLGVTVKKLRETRGMSRIELSEAVGISESHLKKIEAGNRQPGIQTYRKMIAVLEADIVIRDTTGTVMGDCTARAQKVFMESTEAQAIFLVQVLEYMAQVIKLIK